MSADLLVWILSGLLVAAGLAGMVVPLLPGPLLLFAGLFLAAWNEDFSHVGAGLLAVLALLALLCHVLDIAATALGARRHGASGRAVAGASLGALAGLFFGLPGLIAGPLLGAALGELSLRRSLPQAARAGFGAFIGLVIAAAGKLGLGLVMVGLYLLARLW